VRDYLTQLKGEAVPALTRALNGQDGKLRLEAAKLLLALSPRHSAASSAIEYGFTHGECDQKASLSGSLLSLKPGEKTRLAKDLVGCLASGQITLPSHFVNALARLAPLKGELLKSIEDLIFYGPEEHFALRQGLLEEFPLLSKDQGRTVSVATTVLKQGSDLLKGGAFSLLRKVNGLNETTRVLLEEISFGVDRRLARDALRTLVTLDPQERYLEQFADLLQQDGFIIPLLNHYLPKKSVGEILIRLLPRPIGERGRELVLESLRSHGMLSSKGVRSVLEEMLFHPKDEVRRVAAYGLLANTASLFGCNLPSEASLPLCLDLLCHFEAEYGEMAASSWYTESVRSIVCSIEK